MVKGGIMIITVVLVAMEDRHREVTVQASIMHRFNFRIRIRM